MNSLLTAACAMSALAGMACAGVSVVFLPPGFLITDLSHDGSVGTGNVQGDGSFETFRWVRDGIPERLGRATVPVIGSGAGSPDLSYDGTRISASILSSDNNLTQGIWDQTTGWTETMPPPPPGGILLDSSYGSAWGLSGDGSTLVGFYWGSNGRAIACSWSSSTGMVALGQTLGRSARVDAASFDGSVAGGWEDVNGPRIATIWRDGVKLTVADGDGGGGGGVFAVNHDGSIAVGFEYDESVITRVPTIWTWNGSSYDMQNLTYLPGTTPQFGQSYLNSVSDDGQLAGGSNVFTQNPGAGRAGIIWTPTTGVINAVDYIASVGAAGSFSPDMELREIVSISPDGGAISGIVLLTGTFQLQSFVLYLNNDLPCDGDANGDGVVNFTDLNIVLGAFGLLGDDLPGDLNGDGVVNFADLNEILANFGNTCP